MKTNRNFNKQFACLLVGIKFEPWIDRYAMCKISKEKSIYQRCNEKPLIEGQTMQCLKVKEQDK